MKNAETVRRQVQDQSAVEHAHWLRQQRLNAYEGFLEAWDECLRITQAPAAHDPNSTDLDDLQTAAGRMVERARRIALLGPDDVTHEAAALAETMQEDIAVSVRFMQAADAAITAVDARPIPTGAMAEATAEYERRTQQLGELVQDRTPDELDGHPLLRDVMDSIEQYQGASSEARGALQANLEELSATMGEASAMLDTLNRNDAAREQGRERFTGAVRKALGTLPTPDE